MQEGKEAGGPADSEKDRGAINRSGACGYHPVTDKAIRGGFANLKDGREYNNLYDAAMCRAEADWLVGITPPGP